MSVRVGAWFRNLRGAVMALGVFVSGCASLPEPSSLPPGLCASACQVPEAQERALSCADAARLAVERSIELRAEREALGLKAGAWALGFREYLPDLSVSWARDERLSFASSDHAAWTLSLGVSQTLWDGGKLRRARTLESAGLSWARAEMVKKERALAEAAISAYRNVLAARARLELLRQSNERAALELEMLECEVELGFARLDVLADAGYRLDSMSLDIQEADLGVEQAERQLAMLLFCDGLPELGESVDTEERALDVDGEKLVAAALERSPDVDAAARLVEQRRVEAEAAAWAWLPVVRVDISARFGGDEFPLTDAAWTANVTLSYDGPWLSGQAGVSGGLEGRDARRFGSSSSVHPVPAPAESVAPAGARLALQQAIDAYDSTRRAVELGARLALTRYGIAARRRDSARSGLDLARRQQALCQVRVRLGQATRLEALDAELACAKAELGLLDAAMGLLSAQRDLERILGLDPGALPAFAGGVRQ